LVQTDAFATMVVGDCGQSDWPHQSWKIGGSR